jgi:hypothetical protein
MVVRSRDRETFATQVDAEIFFFERLSQWLRGNVSFE